jgi:hypothetical protein
MPMVKYDTPPASAASRSGSVNAACPISGPLDGEYSNCSGARIHDRPHGERKTRLVAASLDRGGYDTYIMERRMAGSMSSYPPTSTSPFSASTIWPLADSYRRSDGDSPSTPDSAPVLPTSRRSWSVDFQVGCVVRKWPAGRIQQLGPWSAPTAPPSMIFDAAPTRADSSNWQARR